MGRETRVSLQHVSLGLEALEVPSCHLERELNGGIAPILDLGGLKGEESLQGLKDIQNALPCRFDQTRIRIGTGQIAADLLIGSGGESSRKIGGHFGIYNSIIDRKGDILGQRRSLKSLFCRGLCSYK